MKAFLRPHRFRHLYPVRFYTTKVISGHSQTSDQCPLYPQKRTSELSRGMSALCRFCCKRRLKAFWVSDSVAVMRFATGADHDGAAQSRPGATFLFIQPR